MPFAASITCSRLSSTRRTRRDARCARRRSSGPPVPDAPIARATASNAASASVTGERSTKKTPSGARSACSAPTCTASLVLPMPPGPNSVSRRTPGSASRSRISRSSRSRPTSSDVCVGRLFGRSVRVLRGGNSLASAGCSHLEDALPLQQVLEPMLAEVDQGHLVGQVVLDELRGAGRDEHLATMSDRADPRGAMHVDPDVGSSADPSLARVESHAHPDPCVVGPWMTLESRAAPRPQREEPGARPGRRRRTSRPPCSTTRPSFASTADRTMS